VLAEHGMQWLMERDDAERECCPECDAAPGATCVNVHTGQLLAGQPAHWQRIRARSRAARGTSTSTCASRSARRSPEHGVQV
jgi:hypothetical protein